MTIALDAEAATHDLAGRIAGLARPGDAILLEGGLGSGKTSFARGFLRALGIAEEVPSPTFTLLQVYDTANGPVWHFDLYRLKRPDEALELGLEEGRAEAILLIEWPERLGAQTGAWVKARVNRAPWRASASRCGVRACGSP